ncbi:hypothetical protein C8J57DRAFT_1471810 [Mycena rebaudengoi]|nr:hypothetical protein C8J57DRAFT_1471810 [Mycena rebaudengoi]
MFRNLLSTAILAFLILGQGALSAPQLPVDALELRSTCCPSTPRSEILKRAVSFNLLRGHAEEALTGLVHRPGRKMPVSSETTSSGDPGGCMGNTSGSRPAQSFPNIAHPRALERPNLQQVVFLAVGNIGKGRSIPSDPNPVRSSGTRSPGKGRLHPRKGELLVRDERKSSRADVRGRVADQRIASVETSHTLY